MIYSTSTVTNFFLTGFTACGKTTVGSRLANLTKMEFVDLDEKLQQRTHKPIPVLFHEMGEEQYRRLEGEVLCEMVQRQRQVIALGAGTITVPLNCEIIQQHGMIIFLDLSLGELFERIRLTDKRVLFHLPMDTIPLDDAMLYRRIQSLFDLRRPYYQVADITVSISEMTLDQVVQAILFSLQKFRFYPTEVK